MSADLGADALRVVKVRAHTLRVPFTVPLRNTPTDAEITLLELEAANGMTGQAACYYPTGEVLRQLLADEAGPVLVGADATRPEVVRHTLRAALRQAAGLAAWGGSLIDLALWDLRGKGAGLPVWKLLGGARSEVPTYVTFGLPAYTNDELTSVARQLVDEGHKRLKIIVGAGPRPRHGVARDPLTAPSAEDLERDAIRVEAVREAVGENVALMIDANRNLPLPSAVALAQRLSPVHLAWFEDPVERNDVHLLAQLRRKVDVPIAVGGMGIFDPLRFRDLLEADAVDILQPNVRDSGGYTGGLKAAALAEAYGVPLGMGGNWPHLNAHLHAGVPNGGWVEYHWQGWKVAETLYTGVPVPEAGLARMGETPGIGVRLRDGVLEDLAVGTSQHG